MIQLSKGGNINLAKEANGVTEFSIGLGWDIATQAGVEFDLDVATIPLNAQDKAVDPDDGFIFYNNPNWKDAIKHSGDNRTGAGDDETIVVDTTKVPVNVLAKFNLEDGKEGTKISDKQAVILGIAYKKDGEWRFKAVGEFGGWTSIDAMKRPTIAFL